MSGVTRQLSTVAAVTVVAAAVLAALALGRSGSPAPRRPTATARLTATTRRPRASRTATPATATSAATTATAAPTTPTAPAAPAAPTTTTAPSTPTAPAPPLGPLPPADPGQLVEELDLAHRVIEDRSSSPAQLAAAGHLEQLTVLGFERMRPAARRSLIARLTPGAAATARTNLAAEASLRGIEPLPPQLPPWRIVAPLPAPTLLALFRSAGARYGVDWHDLAAIMLIETRFGRIHGPSTAGAQGPMQFMPSTWAAYGHGDIHDPRAAIPAAARFLVANGARRDLSDALLHYNNSLGYVHAVQDYAARMRADPRSFLGYYEWQIIYADRRGTMILPTGFPRVRPIPLR